MEGITPDKTIDIRGLVCPYTFVRSKLAIESIEVGQVLEIRLDSEEASRNIPKSMKDHGHVMLREEKVSDKEWILVVRKENE